MGRADISLLNTAANLSSLFRAGSCVSSGFRLNVPFVLLIRSPPSSDARVLCKKKPLLKSFGFPPDSLNSLLALAARPNAFLTLLNPLSTKSPPEADMVEPDESPLYVLLDTVFPDLFGFSLGSGPEDGLRIASISLSRKFLSNAADILCAADNLFLITPRLLGSLILLGALRFGTSALTTTSSCPGGAGVASTCTTSSLMSGSEPVRLAGTTIVPDPEEIGIPLITCKISFLLSRMSP